MARYHNVYGTYETYDGGREKAPAAICRTVAQARLSGRHEIEIWGDGEQTRSFTYIDDCLRGTHLVMRGDYADPVNVGSTEMVTINQLVSLAEEIAGVRLQRRYNLDAPRGVGGRNSDNQLITSLRLGACHTAAHRAGGALSLDFRRTEARRRSLTAPIARSKRTVSLRSASCFSPSGRTTKAQVEPESQRLSRTITIQRPASSQCNTRGRR